jgi:hypothetical protein
MNFPLIYIVLSFLLAYPCVAQDMPATEPPVSQSQLDLFLGSWSGSGYYEGEGKKYEFKMTFSGKSIVNGKAIEIDPSADVKGMGPYREKSLIAWDPMLEQVSMLTVSNFGEVGKYTGDWEVGTKTTLKLKETKVVSNDRFDVEHTLIFHDGNKLLWRVLSTKNGGAIGTYEGTFTKR